MSSQSSTAADYTYQRPSTTATRAIITGKNPTTQPSASSGTDALEAHQQQQQRPTMATKTTTDNYERAAIEASKSGKAPAAVAPASSSNADNAGAPADVVRPGMARQQSWQMRDFKGEQQGNMLAGAAATLGHGYSSTGK